jgi:choline-sulfatase
MTDQHRADHVGFLPGSRLATPNLDRLAGSVGFSNALTVNPICTPARSCLLTGKYSHQIGMLAMSGDLSLQHPTYPRALQAAGYWTAGVGKFHWLQNWSWKTPRGKGHDLISLRDQIMQYGFDYTWECAGKQLAVRNLCDYGAYLREHDLLEAFRSHVEACGPNGQDPAVIRFNGDPWPFAEEHYVDCVTGREILRALDARPRDRPFFLFGSFCGPHKPYDPPRSFLERYPETDDTPFIPGAVPLSDAVRQRLQRLRRAYKAMIGVIDEQVGLILARLEKEGLLDSTVILLTSDHGEMLGDHARMSKLQPWRQSVAVPTAIRHPGYLGQRTCQAPVEITDLTATMLDIAGIDYRKALSKPWPAFHNRVPCRSLLPIVRGEQTRVRDTAFSECANLWELIQSDDWKYVRYLAGPQGEPPRELLFNVRNDPDELLDRSGDGDCRSVLAELRAARETLMDMTPPAQLGWAPFG